MSADDLFAQHDANSALKRNRKQRRDQIRATVGRKTKKEVFGWGKWRRQGRVDPS